MILEAWASDLASCCEEAVAALVATFATAAPAAAVGEHHLHLAPATPESLLIDVLEEVIFVLDTADDVPVSATVRPAADGGLDVVLTMADRATVEGTGAVPKAVSRSGFQIGEQQGKVHCRFLVDL